MKENLRLILSSIALFSLISCGSVNKPSSSQINDSNSTSSEIEEPSSSDSSEEESSSQESSSKQSSISSSSDEISSSEVSSSSEQSSLPSSSSEEESSSNPDSSSSWVTPEGYYHVIFLNYDDALLYEVDVEEGHEAIYGGETPIRPEDDEFTYEFKGWDQDLTSILSDVTTVAEYTYIAKENWSSIIWFTINSIN